MSRGLTGSRQLLKIRRPGYVILLVLRQFGHITAFLTVQPALLCSLVGRLFTPQETDWFLTCVRCERQLQQSLSIVISFSLHFATSISIVFQQGEQQKQHAQFFTYLSVRVLILVYVFYFCVCVLFQFTCSHSSVCVLIPVYVFSFQCTCSHSSVLVFVLVPVYVFLYQCTCSHFCVRVLILVYLFSF